MVKLNENAVKCRAHHLVQRLTRSTRSVNISGYLDDRICPHLSYSVCTRFSPPSWGCCFTAFQFLGENGSKSRKVGQVTCQWYCFLRRLEDELPLGVAV